MIVSCLSRGIEIKRGVSRLSIPRRIGSAVTTSENGLSRLSRKATGEGWGGNRHSIHVVGHGSIGDPEIAADHGTGGADKSYQEVVDAMFAQGLKKRYIGTVACDICYSALGKPSFAKMLAKELFSRGVRASCVLGYKGPLYSTYDDFCADGSDMGGKYGHRMVELDGVEVKSRKAQERFFGWT